MTNPFEASGHRYLVLTNDEDQHSLWPANTATPDGWRAVHGPSDRAGCLDHITARWGDMRPRSLRRATAPDGAARPDAPPEDGPVEWFTRWARRTPDAPAVLSGTASLTYAELDARSEELAGRLVRRGVGPEDLVALLLPRSADLLVALLAVLKSGAAYVPLDPEYPQDRIAHVLADAAPKVLLTTPELAAKGAAGRDAPYPLFVADPSAEPGDAERGGAPRPRALPDRPAYVIYTSGSTGRPKGVVVTRAALRNFLIAMDELVGLTPRDRLLAVTTIAFDIAGLEMYLPLLQGAAVVIASARDVRDPFAMAELIDRTAATTVQATPSLWQALVTDVPHALGGLRMLVGGEALPTALGERMRRLGRRVVNLYGPTETTIWSTAQEVDGSAAPSSIGRPVRRTQAYVLDDGLHEVQDGAEGELYLAGDGLARGYLHRPALTAERFVADPFGPAGTRMYRTGDLVRRGGDGTLEYLARVDFQVKVRGHRIEPAEIEHVVGGHPDIERAVVTVHEDTPGDARLICHVIAAPGRRPESDAVREYAGRFLPAYMVPAVVRTVEAFPLTPNGKLDRAALTALSTAAVQTPQDGARYLPEDDSVRGAVARAWRQVLNAPVPAGRGFAELGGSSLGAIRAAAALRELTGRAMTATDVLEAACAEDLARTLARAPHAAPPARSGDGRRSAPLSANQRAIWMHEQLSPDPLLYLESYCLELHGDVDSDRLAAAVRRTAQRHPAVGAAVEFDDGEPHLVLNRHHIRLVVRSLPPGLDRDSIRALMRDEAARPVPLDGGPLLRVLLFRAPDGVNVLLLTWHHLVMDGWSLREFLRDLGSFHDGPGAAAAEIPVTVCDLNAASLRSDAAPAAEDALAEAAEALRGAVDRSVTAEPAHWSRAGVAHAVEFTLPGDLARRVEGTSAATGHPPFVLICAAYRQALSTVLGLPDPLLAVAVSGREPDRAAEVVGCFVNTVLLAGVPTEDLDGPELLAATRALTDRALAVQEHVPFSRLVQTLRRTARLPMDFPRLYLSVDDEPALCLDGVDTEVVPVTPDRAKFAVTLSLLRAPGRLSGRLEHRDSVLPPGEGEVLLKAFESALDRLAGTAA
ncbi:non-ribosomal peptide synthetase [Streptomyces sp. SID14515]|uniref:non-ribosomal peptide synthetase n=1 Tax=Streptomyces sp. SID14515 TaxID=2706074 RepID=UPI0013CDBFCA|nr:non-ribosomal peptide synthetase [Streptomyces sp. SID14515]NEB39618.1 amino acid adenylation domain-containing protein [Streptomyces sp. SID14515]